MEDRLSQSQGHDDRAEPRQGLTTGSHPQDFCPKCKQIGAGKLEKIAGPRLDLPSTKPTPIPKTTTATTIKKAS